MSERKEPNFGPWVTLSLRLGGMTQADLAASTNLDPGTISKIITGAVKQPDIETVIKIWDALSVNAQTKGIPIAAEYIQAMINGAGYATNEQIESSYRLYASADYSLGIANRLREEKEKTAALEREIEDLKDRLRGPFGKRGGVSGQRKNTDA